MRTCYSILFLFLVMSCSFFTKPKDLETAKKEIKENFDFSDVDSYPLFDTCKETELLPKEAQKECFYNEVSSHIQNYLANELLETETIIEDTLVFNIEISQKGKFKLIDVQGETNNSDTLTSIKLICNEAITTLPKIDPALEKDEPVKVRFQLPLVLASVKNE